MLVYEVDLIRLRSKRLPKDRVYRRLYADILLYLLYRKYSYRNAAIEELFAYARKESSIVVQLSLC